MPQRNRLSFRHRKGASLENQGTPGAGTKCILLKKQPPGRQKVHPDASLLLTSKPVQSGLLPFSGAWRNWQTLGFPAKRTPATDQRGSPNKAAGGSACHLLHLGTETRARLIAGLRSCSGYYNLFWTEGEGQGLPPYPQPPPPVPILASPLGCPTLRLSGKVWACKTSCVPGIPRPLKVTERQFSQTDEETFKMPLKMNGTLNNDTLMLKIPSTMSLGVHHHNFAAARNFFFQN